jgi:ACS family glucarate transporter-like MFS transporter
MRKRTIVLGFLVTLSVLTFVDRLCIAVAGPRIQQDLGLTPEQWGWVLGAFVLAYGLFEIPTGAMGDRTGQRKVITRIVLWWSAFTALTGSVNSFLPLVATRFLFGAGEAGAYPNMAGVTARWFPPRERARTQGFIWGASRAGGALAPLIVVPLQAAFGWRASFWIFGIVGVLWCAVWWWWFRDEPAQKVGISEAELAEIGPPAAPAHGAPWLLLLRSRQIWTIVGMYGAYAWGSWFYFSWLHTWLVKGRGFTEAEMGLFSALPFAVGAMANIAGGFLSDAAVRVFGPARGRKLVGSVCLAAGSLLLVATGLTQNKTAAVALLTAGFGVMDLMLPSAWAICLDVGGARAGSVTGAMNTAGQFGGFLCTVVFGQIVGRFQSYDAPLFVIAGMVALSAFLFTRIDPGRPVFGQTAAPVAEPAPAVRANG